MFIFSIQRASTGPSKVIQQRPLPSPRTATRAMLDRMPSFHSCVPPSAGQEGWSTLPLLGRWEWTPAWEGLKRGSGESPLY